MEQTGGLRAAMPNRDLPIVGQQFDVAGWFVTVGVKCRCEARGFFLVAGQVGQAMAQCPECKKFAVIQGLTQRPDGQWAFTFGIGIAAEEPVK